MTKRYFVKYTMYDGEHEYADHVTHDLDPELVYTKLTRSYKGDDGVIREEEIGTELDDAYVLNAIMYLDEPDELMVAYDDHGHYEIPNRGDYRLYVLDSVKVIPKADIKILNKYGV